MFYITDFRSVWVSASEYFNDDFASHISSTYPLRSVEQKLPFVLKHRIKRACNSVLYLGPSKQNELCDGFRIAWSLLLQTKLWGYQMELFQMSTLITHDSRAFILPNRELLFCVFWALFNNCVLQFVTLVLYHTSSYAGKSLKIRFILVSSRNALLFFSSSLSK